MADSRAAYEAIAADLASSSAVSSKMFGMPCLKIGKKAFAGLTGENMVFKLGGRDHAEALALSDAHLFDPANMGRPMKEWVVVPMAHASRWPDLAEKALGYVAESV